MSAFVGRRLPEPVVRIRPETLRVPIPLQIAWAAVKLLAKVVVIIITSPVMMGILTAAGIAWALWRIGGPPFLVCGVLLVAALLVGLRFWQPALYERHVSTVLRSRWRRFSVYRYKWPATMDLADLNGRRNDGSAYEPRLLTVRSTRSGDVVRARMLAGQTVEDWGKVSDRLRQTFGAVSCRVRSVPNRPHDLDLWFLRADPLTEIVQPYDHRGVVRLDALPVARREDGQPYRLPLLGNHVLISGATGSGKSGVEWEIIDQLAPSVADGTVMLLGVDPKMMEFALGGPLFTRTSYATAADHADVLEEAVQLMRDRQAALRTLTRLHEPTQAEPLVVVLIDELAGLTYVTERDLKRRIDAALGLLLTQGRAVGVTVVAGVQDPRKETVPLRGLFPIRIALRLTEADEVTLVLGPGARDRGARCDEIPESLQGVAFVQVEGVAEPVRVRFAYVTDDHICALAAGWGRPGLSLVPDAPSGPVEAPEAA